MTLQTTGPISLADIATEFGGTVPHSLSEYYRNGGRVPTANQNLSIPTSGAISFSNFYGSVNRLAVYITISSNLSNYFLDTSKINGYIAGLTDVFVTINSGVYVYSVSSEAAYGAFGIDGSWAAGDTISIVNNGFIIGMGGAGGRGNGDLVGTAGSSGGRALVAGRAVSVTNNGTIAGGGGGGGGGGSGFEYYGGGEETIIVRLAGGGGGGGRTGLTNSPGGISSGGVEWAAGASGQVGTLSSSGSGGAGGSAPFYGAYGGTGGSGGTYGTSGSSGSSANIMTPSGGGPKAGGAGGAAVVGNSNITWIATGTRLGAIT